MPPREASTREVPTREARERLALVPDSTLLHRLDVDEHVRGASLLRASVGARLGLVAGAACLLWLAVYWALA